ncbi:MAG: DUF3644 domain-containing protein [Candidatus Poribacteria bacterium]|nr:DUF3644 domain-containing protein [Candidatus Poribacteria bacterium]
MKLRKGKTKNILEGSIDAALLAVEVYNKPRTTFRSQAYIVLMIIAWTRLFHAYFRKTIGDRYYHKEKGRYQLIDGERKAWELKTCIDKYGNLSEPIRANLQFFIGLRNKIEHHNVTEREVDVLIFGECQSLLYNYENLLIQIFGEEYALNESLAFSLQFSYMRTDVQRQANRSVLSAELREVRNYIENYRSSLSEDIFNSQEYSIKLIQIPKVSNTNRNDLAVEFVRADELDPDTLQHITAIIKDKRVVIEARNVGKLRAGKVVEKVKEQTRLNFNQYDHKCLYTIFDVRPPGSAPNPDETNTEYCHYDEVHKDYIYQDSWVDFIVKLFEIQGLTKEEIRLVYKAGEKWDINQYC